MQSRLRSWTFIHYIQSHRFMLKRTLTWKLSLEYSAELVYKELSVVQNPLQTPYRCLSKWSWAFGLLWAVHPVPKSQLHPPYHLDSTLLPSSSRSTSSKWTLKKYRWPRGRTSARRRRRPKISSLCAAASSVFTTLRRFTARPNRPPLQDSWGVKGSSWIDSTSGQDEASTLNYAGILRVRVSATWLLPGRSEAGSSFRLRGGILDKTERCVENNQSTLIHRCITVLLNYYYVELHRAIKAYKL